MSTGSTTDQKTFETWGILELFGHLRLTGKISEQIIGGCAFIRIDVPAVGDAPEYTRYFTQGAIYSMTPTSEEIARSLAERLRAVPVSAYDLPKRSAPALSHDDSDDP